MANETIPRKLTVILAADVAGYSRLTGMDEEGTLSRFKTYRNLIVELVGEHRGRVFSGSGDALVAEFASAVEATRCAMAVQTILAEHNEKVPIESRMLFRIGINIGDVMIDGDDLFGDGVNVAARLENLAEPGGICISSNVFEQIRTRVDAGFADIGLQRVKNIAEPIRVYRLMPDGKSGIVVGAAWGRLSRSRLGATLGALILASGVVALGLWYVFPIEKAAARKLSLVVLPFTNLSGDKSQDYFADAVTEDLITDLSRIRGAFVIARGTSFTFKGKPTDARQVARDLGVRYVLEGSIRRLGQRVRVNAQLIDGGNGAHLWAEKFDRELKDVIAVQSAITGHIASVLRAELLEAESRLSKPGNLEAWDFALQGTVKLHTRYHGPDVMRQAKQLFEKALALDRTVAMAWEGLSFIHFAAATREIPGVSQPNSSDLSLEAARRAIAADPRSSNAYRVLGLAHYWRGEGAKALEACRHAVDLNRNNDLAIVCLARANFTLGKMEEANRLIYQSIELNPRSQLWLKNFYLGTGYFYLRKFPEAVVVLEKATSANPKHASVKLYYAMSLVMADRPDDAKLAYADYLRLARGKRNTIEKLRADRARMIPDFESLAKALRRLGMPER